MVVVPEVRKSFGWTPVSRPPTTYPRKLTSPSPCRESPGLTLLDMLQYRVGHGILRSRATTTTGSRRLLRMGGSERSGAQGGCRGGAGRGGRVLQLSAYQHTISSGDAIAPCSGWFQPARARDGIVFAPHRPPLAVLRWRRPGPGEGSRHTNAPITVPPQQGGASESSDDGRTHLAKTELAERNRAITRKRFEAGCRPLLEQTDLRRKPGI